MKKSMLKSKLLAVGLSAAMVLTSGAAAFAADTQTLAATAPQVQLNGQTVQFKDAAPQNVDGRVMVPFTAMLEALGAKVNYDKPTQTVTAVNGDTTLEFQIGKPDLKLTTGGKTVDKTMDVAPYVDAKTNRTYVSTRFVSEAFGYSVGWDKAAKTVVVIDYDKMFANVNKDFSILSMPDGSGYDMSKTYQTTGSFNGDLTLMKLPGADGKTTNMKLSFDASMTGLQKAMAADMIMKLNLNMDDFVKMLTSDPKMDQASKDQIQKTFDSLKNVQMEVKMGDDMVVYMKSPLFSQLGSVIANQKVTDDTWFKVNAGAMYQAMGIDLKSMMQEKASGSLNLGQLLADTMKSASSDMTVDTYARSQATYSMMKDLLGDQAFTTSGNVHTVTIDKAAVAAELVKYGKALDLSAEDIADLSKADINATIAITEDNGKNTNTKMDVKYSVDGNTMNLSVDGNALNMTLKLAVSAVDEMSMNLNITVKSAESTDTVDSTIPAGAQVIDLMEMPV